MNMYAYKLKISRSLFNIKVMGQSSRSHVFACSCVHDTACYPRAVLSLEQGFTISFVCLFDLLIGIGGCVYCV